MRGKLGKYRNLAVAVATVLLLFVFWRVVTGWIPSRSDYAMQGVAVDASNGKPTWPELAATGVDFAYLTATVGTQGRDPEFANNLEGVRDAGIRYGVLHKYDICRLASDQATLFITTVPREKNMLPAAVALDFSESCSSHPDRGLVLSEVTTFLGQIEAHLGMPSVLLLAPDFERQYQVSKSINRNVWLERNWLLPDYAAKPWVMWTANNARRMSGIGGTVRWAVVRK